MDLDTISDIVLMKVADIEKRLMMHGSKIDGRKNPISGEPNVETQTGKTVNGHVRLTDELPDASTAGLTKLVMDSIGDNGHDNNCFFMPIDASDKTIKSFTRASLDAIITDLDSSCIESFIANIPPVIAFSTDALTVVGGAGIATGAILLSAVTGQGVGGYYQSCFG
jgi:hypothetical protein